MRRAVTILALLGLVVVLAAGCWPWGKPTGSGSTVGGGGRGGGDGGSVYNGEPTHVVIQLTGSQVARHPFRLLPVAFAAESQSVVVRIANYNEYGQQIYEVFKAKPYDSTQGAAFEVTIPARRGYEISGVAHGSGLKAVGLVSNIGAAADTTTVVTVPMAAPPYSLAAPLVVYQGGTVKQFAAHSDHVMVAGNTDVLIGTREWKTNSLDAFWRANDPKQGGWGAISLGSGGVVGPRTFPAVNIDTTLYYQVRVCAKPMYTGSQLYCYYDPDVEAGQPLWTATLSAGPPQ